MSDGPGFLFVTADEMMKKMARFEPPQIQAKKALPPGLQESSGEKSCGDCMHSTLILGRAWRGDTRCVKYGMEVPQSAVCDYHRGQDD